LVRAPNILVAVSAFFWLAFALMGSTLVAGVAERVGSVNVGQLEFYVIFPLVVVVSLALSAWVGTKYPKSEWLQVVLSVLALVLLLPYCTMSGGGV